MTILTLPTSPKVRRATFSLVTLSREFISPLTRHVQQLDFSGARWSAQFEFPPMSQADAGYWTAFLAKLRGRAGRFYAGDPSGPTPRGTATGSPIVSGANQTGTRLLTSGWTVNQTTALLAGDYLAWDTPTGWREMHMAVEDVASSGTGIATIHVAPPIRESPANGATLILQTPTCVMALASPADSAWRATIDRAVYFTFNGIEMYAPSEGE